MNSLGPLYHWSPRNRLTGINRRGLVPGQRNHHGATRNDDGTEFRQPAVCASPDPATAWAYSHGAWNSTGTFDLWQFWLVDGDDVEVRRMWGARIVEVRVHNRIRKARVVWVAERTVRDSLDGREHRELDHDRGACPLCSGSCG